MGKASSDRIGEGIHVFLFFVAYLSIFPSGLIPPVVKEKGAFSVKAPVFELAFISGSCVKFMNEERVILFKGRNEQKAEDRRESRNAREGRPRKEDGKAGSKEGKKAEGRKEGRKTGFRQEGRNIGRKEERWIDFTNWGRMHGGDRQTDCPSYVVQSRTRVIFAIHQ